jgi:hypothetical protein
MDRRESSVSREFTFVLAGMIIWGALQYAFDWFIRGRPLSDGEFAGIAIVGAIVWFGRTAATLEKRQESHYEEIKSRLAALEKRLAKLDV